MKDVQAKHGAVLHLGRCGENRALRVWFDVCEWQRLYGEGTVQLIHQRNGDTNPYRCHITVNGGMVSWVVTNADVAVAGKGRAELQYHVDDVLVKSDIYTTNTTRSMSTAGPVPPEPEEGWVQEVLNASVVADHAASAAQGSAQTAEGWAHDAESSAQMARGAASQAQSEASQAQSAADQAQSAAQTAAMDAANAAAPLAAQQAVAEAENRLVGYQANAANSAQSALQSEQNAAQSAQAAASSEEETERMAQAADVAKNEAEKAEKNAKNAKSAAETAKNAAETAAGEAKTSADNAYDSALTAGACLLNTESYMQKAQSSADRAESAAERAESAGIQSDWNQNDSAADDYVKNRPFYRTSTPVYEEYQLLPERMITFDGQVAAFTYPVDVPTGRCTVFWGGSQYECDPVVTDGGFYLIQPDVFTIEYSAGGAFKVTALNRYDQLVLKITSLRVAGYEVVKLPNEYLDADYIKEVAGEHGGGDSVQSDWNQNDSNAAGYIKNRPFYDGSVVILPETTLVFEDDGFFYQPISGEFDIKPGETYIVNWNGVEYECVTDYDGESIYLEGMGDVAYINYFPDDDPPHIEVFDNEAGTVTVSISTDGIAKLPNKYLDADYIKEVSRDDAHIKEVVNEDYIKEVASEDYIKGVVNEDYIKEAVGEAEYIAPDWDQNVETAAGYIKNRPFYTEGRGEVLPETDFDLDGGFHCDTNPAKTTLVAGETYTIRVYTDEYSVVRDVVCTEIQRDEFMEGVETWQVLEVVEPDYGTHILVGFLHSKYIGDYWALIESDDGLTGTVYVEINQNVVIHKLPDKYLDMTAEVWTFELEDGSTVTKQVMVK